MASEEKALVPRQAHASLNLMGEGFERVERMATGLAKSGMFKDTNAGQALAKILIGADMGLTPTQALMTIDLVRGNVQLRGKLLLAWVRGSDQYDYEVVERSPERGAIQFHERSKRTGEWQKIGPRETPESEPGPITFTLEEAKAAGLVTANGGWDKWPANMCLWRCASIGVNLLCPDLLGGVPVYTEADSFVDGSAVEIGSGEGDGTPPGWDGLPDEAVADVEALLGVAEAMGHPLDLGSVQLRLNGRPEAVADFIANTNDMLAKHEPEGGES